jgi:hypothetical protein
VKRVNHATTRCADGRFSSQCYVAEIDWNGQLEVQPRRALLRGKLLARRFAGFGNLGAFVVSESWKAASDKTPTGTFYRVRDRGIRCITHPCLTHHAAQLNSTAHRNVAGVEMEGTEGGDSLIAEAQEEMTKPKGLLVSGVTAAVTGPAGRAMTLRASQFYFRADQEVTTPPPDTKPPSKGTCKKTGCSGQICSDEEVMTTCEWRPEYACYRTARCERQANGKCGFTQTPELIACLARPPRQ